MIAITGANGQLGRLVITSLLDKVPADNIVALVRNPASAADLKAKGVQVRQADYDAPETWARALAGVEKLLLISGNEVGRRVPQHQTVIDAAKAANIRLLAYTSLLKADTTPMVLAQEHRQTEAYIAESAVPAVILRNGWYLENYTDNIQLAIEHGVVAGAVGDGRISAAARADYAEAAAVVLSGAADYAGNVYELAGDVAFGLDDYAAEIATQSQKAVVYQALDAEAYQGLLVDSGVPEGFAQVLVDSDLQAGKGWLQDDAKQLSGLIQRPTTSLAQAVANAL